MNIEKSIEILKALRNYNKFYKEENTDLTITITLEAKESIDKAIETLLTAYEQEKEKNKDMSCDLTETRADNIDESTMLKQIKLKLQEKNIPIETLLAEFERLEEIEDRKVQIEYNNVFNKGVKSVEDKIKEKIEEIKKSKENIYFEEHLESILQSLLEKE